MCGPRFEKEAKVFKGRNSLNKVRQLLTFMEEGGDNEFVVS